MVPTPWLENTHRPDRPSDHHRLQNASFAAQSPSAGFDWILQTKPFMPGCWLYSSV